MSRTAIADAAGRLSLRYDRFARLTARQSLDLELRSQEPESDFELWLDDGFLSRVQIESIVPEPDEQSSSADGVRLKFDINPASLRAPVVIRYRPVAPGLLHGRLRAGQATVSFEQFVYP